MENEKKQTLLCVDDDQKNLELLEALLLPLGYEIKLSQSGEDALQHIAHQVPDLILLDIMMPGMSGLDVLKRLRADEKTRLVPIVMVTALHAADDKALCLEAGCDEFISKPFDSTELIARVRSLLKINLYRDSLSEKEKLWNVIHEMSQPLIVCRPDWVITHLNRAAQRYLMPSAEFENVNFLDFIFEHYSVSVPWSELNDVSSAPKSFTIEKKNAGPSAPQRAEVSLEVFENAAHEVINMVLTLQDVLNDSK